MLTTIRLVTVGTLLALPQVSSNCCCMRVDVRREPIKFASISIDIRRGKSHRENFTRMQATYRPIPAPKLPAAVDEKVRGGEVGRIDSDINVNEHCPLPGHHTSSLLHFHAFVSWRVTRW